MSSSRTKVTRGDSRGSCGLSLCPHLPSTLSTKTGFMATLALEREAEVSATWLSFFTTKNHPIEKPALHPSTCPLPCRLLATDTNSQILSSLSLHSRSQTFSKLSPCQSHPIQLGWVPLSLWALVRLLPCLPLVFLSLPPSSSLFLDRALFFIHLQGPSYPCPLDPRYPLTLHLQGGGGSPDRNCLAPGWLCISQSPSPCLCLQTCLTRAGGAQIKGAGPALQNLPTGRTLQEDVILFESKGAAGHRGVDLRCSGMCKSFQLREASGFKSGFVYQRVLRVYWGKEDTASLFIQ